MEKLTKKRCLIPGKIVDLLWTDDEIFNESSKLKKHFTSNFPKNDQFTSQEGFHIHFALAGYSPDSIQIMAKNPYLFVSSARARDLPEHTDEESGEVKTSFSKGMFSRGIAQRDFDIKYLISEEFDVENLTAEMVHGLLKILVPYRKESEPKVFQVKNLNN